ncbi:16S rRNA (uracil(1498)-N(3))-methyltransferase [Caenimonas sp. SL110]|uniref:16S rRNA (uracil(1498)-N(3))-methyltransferase n=1 Tax=Caenimonas sp. SL110 TaxID=1450524 RepID=UPI00065497DD|nr:16S rRNA (uracil(1498)-N(3))-methyltransferase [Caenimonas sp. SL110]
MPRFYCDVPLVAGESVELPEGPARHVQVLRLQPGSAITLFNGEGGEYEAVVEQMGRSSVRVNVGVQDPIEREAPRAIHLALGMPANERMDWLVEKATELGVASIQPLVTERTVLKFSGERAQKKQAHWQAVAVAACEQCGRNRVPQVFAVAEFARWLGQPPVASTRLVLSLSAHARPAVDAAGLRQPLLLLSGPEGGLSSREEQEAIAREFAPATLGTRVLRAETAPLALLAALTLAAS